MTSSAPLEIREVSDLGGLGQISRLLDAIWAGPQAVTVMPLETLRMLSFTGSYVAGAFTGADMVGAAVGVLARHGEEIELHSHVAGVTAAARGAHVGRALKLHQRQWALDRGIDVVSWTFDPLVRRNAVFNLHSLGATVERYFVDFYGDMPDGINAGQGSDRLLVRWQLTAPAVVARVAGKPPPIDEPDGETIVLDQQRHERPIAGDALLCAIPDDIESLRRTTPGEALAWRGALRAALTGALDTGYRISGVLPSGWYVLRAGEQDASREGR